MSSTRSKKKIVVLFGTRPEAIKLAPLCLELARRSDEFELRVWVSAQHRQMLDQVLAVFDITPDRDFNLMRPGQTLTQVTCGVLTAMEQALAEERPDWVIVQGDTTTAFAGALAAFYAQVSVGHVEAGLRTGNKFAPFPEEINRRLGSSLADLHFAPTPWSAANLRREAYAPETIHVTGNTVIDALAIAVEKVRCARPPLPAGLPASIGVDDGQAGRRMILITGHRRENFGTGFESLCAAIAGLAASFPDCDFVYPVHLNPNVQEPVRRILAGRNNVYLIEPQDYLPFVWLLSRAYFVLTDSGGIQEEAPFLGKPVLVMRETTERPEAIEGGTAKLVGTDRETIEREAARLLNDPAAYAAMSQAHNPFGDGKASEHIANLLAASK